MGSYRRTLAVVTLMASVVAACSSSTASNDTQCQSIERNALTAQAWTQVNHLSAALSALQALDRRDEAVAYNTLQAELTSTIPVLRSLLPTTTGKDRDTIEESLTEAEMYARQHNLKVVPP